MPTIPQHWLDSDVIGMDEVALPSGLVYDPLNQCITADGVEWEQPDMLSILRDAIRYRWLTADQDMGQGDVLHGLLHGRPVDGKSVDDEIDDAMTPNDEAHRRADGEAGRPSGGADCSAA